VDGFAGPGEYTNYPSGSPIAALEAAKSVIDGIGADWKAGDVHCAFIEPDRGRFANLEERVAAFRGSRKLHIHLSNSSFVEGLAHLKTRFPSTFRGAQPLFVFIDPFGATGVPFRTVAEVLSSSRSEVLINLDVDGIDRIFKAGTSAKHEALLDEILPDKSWRDQLSEDQPSTQRYRQSLDLYKNGLQNLPRVKYVFAFEMQTSAGAVNYFLVFASQHPLGLEKMKEAMQKMDQTGDYRFSDARVGQSIMFRFDDPDEFSQLMFQRFVGRRVRYAALRDFALNETPFVNPKSMLRVLEKEGKVRVESSDPKRRKGTFNEQVIEHIEFVKGE
jgi:three-Cys-motif partner protein